MIPILTSGAGSPDFAASHWAVEHLFRILPVRLAVGGTLHVETYVSAVGAIAGYAAQRTLFSVAPPIPGVNVQVAQTVSGERYWVGDALNDMMVPRDPAESHRCVWPQAVAGTIAAGLDARALPPLDAMFAHVARTLGNVDEGMSSVPLRHQPHLRARELLRSVWPLALSCFGGSPPGDEREHGPVPVALWSAVAAHAAYRPISAVKDCLPPAIALTILMETAIYCSKLDRDGIETI